MGTSDRIPILDIDSFRTKKKLSWAYHTHIATYFGIPAVEGLPYAVDAMFLSAVFASVANILVVSSCCCCWCPCWMLLYSRLSDSGDPAAVGIHDVPIVPTDAVTFDVNSVPDVVGLPACCCRLHLCKQSQFCWSPYYFSRPVVAFIPAVACISAVVSSHASAVILAQLVAGLPASLHLLAFLLLLASLWLLMFLLLLASLLFWRPICCWRFCCCFGPYYCCCCWHTCSC